MASSELHRTNIAFSDMAYMGDKDFIFISYCHADIWKVESILRYLFFNGLRFWYDQGGPAIKAGSGWKQTIKEKIEKCKIFIVFISNSTIGRPEALDEIKLALKREPSPQILFIVLERTTFGQYPRKIKTYLNKKQYVPLYDHGITETSIEWILNSLQTASVVDDDRRSQYGLEKWEERTPYSVSLYPLPSFHNEDETPYIYDKATPKLVTKDGVQFYQLRPGDTALHTVYPFCFDNMWVPDELMQENAFCNGLGLDPIRGEIVDRQKYELYRALLHSPQIVVNRALIYNSPLFTAYYVNKTSDDAEYLAFCDLLRCGGFVVALIKETSPVQRPNFQIDENVFQSWEQVCKNVRPFCMKFDWEDRAHNELCTNERLSSRLQNFLITAGSYPDFLDKTACLFGIPSKDREQFFAVWRTVQDTVIAWSRKDDADGGQKPYTRERFYRDFLLKDDESSVLKLKIDPHDPFWKELKQIVDYRYFLNFTQAFHLRPLLPEGSALENILFPGDETEGDGRGISSDELIFAANAFRLPFDFGAIPIPDESIRLSLDLVVLFRNSRIKGKQENPWRKYMRAIDRAKKRAEHQILDLFDAYDIYLSFKDWMCAMYEMFPELQWKTIESPSLTINYRIGNRCLHILYQRNHAVSAFQDPAPVDDRSDGKHIVTVDLICGDFREVRNTCFLTEIRLFTSRMIDYTSDIMEQMGNKIQTWERKKK